MKRSEESALKSLKSGVRSVEPFKNAIKLKVFLKKLLTLITKAKPVTLTQINLRSALVSKVKRSFFETQMINAKIFRKKKRNDFFNRT